jgi:hypothetical protein
VYSSYGIHCFSILRGLNEPGGVLGGGGLKCVKPGFWGF